MTPAVESGGGARSPWADRALALLGPVLMIATLVWHAAKYPDPQQLREADERRAADLRAVEGRVQELRVEQVVLRGDINSTRDTLRRLESGVDAIEKKIDEALGKRRGR